MKVRVRSVEESEGDSMCTPLCASEYTHMHVYTCVRVFLCKWMNVYASVETCAHKKICILRVSIYVVLNIIYIKFYKLQSVKH